MCVVLCGGELGANAFHEFAAIVERGLRVGSSSSHPLQRHLQDPDKLIIVRRINKLGFKAVQRGCLPKQLTN